MFHSLFKRKKKQMKTARYVDNRKHESRHSTGTNANWNL